MLNHSCVRCRSKKLRCDGRSPCSNCHEKGIGLTCQRAQRKERPRRADGSKTVTKIVTEPATITEKHAEGTVAEGTEHMMVAVPNDHSQHGVLAKRPGRIQGVPVSAARKSSTSDRPDDSFQVAPSRLRGALVSMQQIDRARKVLGNPRSCGRLLSFVFHYRCQAMAHSAVHLPTLKKTFRQVFSDEWAPELTQDQLSLVLMAIAVSIQFTPRAGPYGYLYSLVHEMGTEYAPEERQIALHDMARQIITQRLASPNATLEGLQTIMLFLMYDLDDDSFKDHIFDHAVRSAQRLGLSHISYDSTSVAPGVSSSNDARTEHEMMVRLWWYFVCRDWLTGLARGSYSIHPNHFTTRFPMVITDEELTEGKLPESQTAMWSPVSVSVPFIGLASLVRQMVDVRNQKSLSSAAKDQSFAEIVSDAFDHFAANIHPLFGLGAEFQDFDSDNVASVRAVQRLETERWILHHQMFHAFLQLHEYRLDEPVPPVMAAFATHILDIQDKIRLRCHIIDSLRINVTGVLRAITVLCIDLMQKHKTSRISLFRQMQLGKIREALRKTKEATRVMDEDIEKIERLLDMENTAWITKIKGKVETPSSLSNVTFSNPAVLTAVSAGSDTSPPSSQSYGHRSSDAGSDGAFGRPSAGDTTNSSQSGAASSTTGITSISSNHSASSVAGYSPTVEVPPSLYNGKGSQATVSSGDTQQQSQQLQAAPGQQFRPYFSASNVPQPSGRAAPRPHHHHSAPGFPLNGHPAQMANALPNVSSGNSIMPNGVPPTSGDMSYLAQWIDLLPTDQALSPIFSNTSNLREPTWEDLYNTFMQQATA